MQLEGSVALVTGSATRVGKSIAMELADVGANVVVHYRDSADAANATVAELQARGVEALAASADLADPQAIEQLFETVAEHFGRLDVLVNSAAIFQKRSLERATLEDWERTIAVNLRAPFLCLQHAARLMRADGRVDSEPGLVVNMADLSGVYPWLGYGVHGVSKAGVLHLTRVGARELAPQVRVNAIVPGAILPPPGMSADSDGWRSMGASVPLGRVGEPAMIGRAVVFLAEADYITGAAIPIDGGEHLVGAARH
jgi:NAD(P)-dependent dehydrogenase (short-subunit alcohol dehydrogenase family)